MNNENAKNLASDIIEATIDSVTNNELLKDIPIIGSIRNLIKTGNSISDFLFAKKLKTFLDDLDKMSSEEKDKMVVKMESGGDYHEKIGLQLLELLNRCDDHDKPRLIATLFRAYIVGEIDRDRFFKYSSIVNSAFIGDIIKLCFLSSIKGPTIKSEVNSLLALGVLDIKSTNIGHPGIIGGVGKINDITYEPNEFGYELIRLIQSCELYQSWIPKNDPD